MEDSDDFSHGYQLSLIGRNDKFIVFMSTNYAIDFEIFKSYSLFFQKNQKFENERYISFVYPSFITEASFITFINACQNKKFEISKKHVFPLYYLAKRFEVPSLKQCVEESISKNRQSLLIESLNYKIFLVPKFSLLSKENPQDLSLKQVEENDSDHFMDISYEVEEIGQNLNLYLGKKNYKDFLLSLPIPPVFKIVNCYALQNNQVFSTINNLNEGNHAVIDFIFEYFGKNGTSASALFSFFISNEIEFDTRLRERIHNTESSYNVQFDWAYFDDRLNMRKDDLIKQNEEFQNSFDQKVLQIKDEITKLRTRLGDYGHTFELIEFSINKEISKHAAKQNE